MSPKFWNMLAVWWIHPACSDFRGYFRKHPLQVSVYRSRVIWNKLFHETILFYFFRMGISLNVQIITENSFLPTSQLLRDQFTENVFFSGGGSHEFSTSENKPDFCQHPHPPSGWDKFTKKFSCWKSHEMSRS